jgi:Zn-dependent M16 (insulinase) family peptidase
VAKGGIGELYGGLEMREETLLEEMKILMKLVEEVLQVVGVDEVDEEKKKAIEEKVWETVKKLRERDISRLLV